MKPNSLRPAIKIWYKSLPASYPILWPILDVDLQANNIVLPQKLLALVDSGASESILHPLVAEALGFNLKKIGKPKKGGLSVSGFYESWILPEKVEVNIYGYSFQTRFTVINNQNLIWACILGEDSVFQYSRIDFQKYKGFFELRLRSDIN